MSSPLTSPLIDPDAALVVVDLQRATTSFPSVGDMDAVVARCARLASKFRACGLPVALARNDLKHPPTGRTTYDRPRPPVPEDALDLAPELGVSAEDIVVTRGAWSAFSNTTLDAQLSGHGVAQLIICGLATNFGVESTARAAYDLGYHVVVVGDAVTGPIQTAHDNTLTTIVPTLGLVATTDEVLASLSPAQQ